MPDPVLTSPDNLYKQSILTITRGYFMAKSIQPDKNEFIALTTATMPFGKYKGMRLVDLPEPYLVWFSQKGFPEGKLGQMLAAVYEIKVNGLEYLFKR
jgi:uncharacterized protein (DUF3820 family)